MLFSYLKRMPIGDVFSYACFIYNAETTFLVCLCFERLWRLELSLWLLAPLSTIFHISLLLADETGARWENYQCVASHWQTLSHNVVSSTPRHDRDLIVICTDCTGSCKDWILNIIYCIFYVQKCTIVIDNGLWE